MQRNRLTLLLFLFLALESNAQLAFNSIIFKRGTVWSYQGDIYKTAYTNENNHDTSYTVNFSMRIIDVYKRGVDTNIIYISNFFDDLIFTKKKIKEGRILVFTKNTLFISKFNAVLDSIDIKNVKISKQLFSVLFSISPKDESFYSGMTKEFDFKGHRIPQDLNEIQGAPLKNTSLMSLTYVNKKLDISASYSSDIGFWNYLFDVAGGQAISGNFQLKSISLPTK